MRGERMVRSIPRQIGGRRYRKLRKEARQLWKKRLVHRRVSREERDRLRELLPKCFNRKRPMLAIIPYDAPEGTFIDYFRF